MSYFMFVIFLITYVWSIYFVFNAPVVLEAETIFISLSHI